MAHLDAGDPAQRVSHARRPANARLTMHEEQRRMGAIACDKIEHTTCHRCVEHRPSVAGFVKIPKLQIASRDDVTLPQRRRTAAGIGDADDGKRLFGRKGFGAGPRRREDQFEHRFCRSRDLVVRADERFIRVAGQQRSEDRPEPE